ncbi:MAG: hypothetical protein QGF80_05370 [Pelagibacteraceae bacterium]|nr:hypothetical protein [Pelagibacteraceae bacterium]
MKYLQNLQWLNDLPSQYLPVLLISLLIIIILTIVALITGKKNIDVK